MLFAFPDSSRRSVGDMKFEHWRKHSTNPFRSVRSSLIYIIPIDDLHIDPGAQVFEFQGYKSRSVIL